MPIPNVDDGTVQVVEESSAVEAKPTLDAR